MRHQNRRRSACAIERMYVFGRLFAERRLEPIPMWVRRNIAYRRRSRRRTMQRKVQLQRGALKQSPPRPRRRARWNQQGSSEASIDVGSHYTRMRKHHISWVHLTQEAIAHLEWAPPSTQYMCCPSCVAHHTDASETETH